MSIPRIASKNKFPELLINTADSLTKWENIEQKLWCTLSVKNYFPFQDTHFFSEKKKYI